MNSHVSQTAAAAEPSVAPPVRAGIARRVVGYLGLWVGLLTCGLLFLGWCGVAVLISPFFGAAERRRIGRLAMNRVFGLYLRLLGRLGLVQVDNDALLALSDEPSLILAPNHPSMMDVILVISRLEKVGCIMKADLWDNIFLGAGARMADFIRNDSPLNMIRMAVKDLQRGSQLLVFPEGTRTVRAPVNPLSRGYALIAKKAAAPIQTILIETDSPYLRKGWPLFRLPPMPIRFRVRLGRRFAPRDDVDALVAEMERYFIEELGPSDPDAAAPGQTPARPAPPARRAA
jgi:1-acyl-sn-glycerol-3-phosphate acyltransferase